MKTQGFFIFCLGLAFILTGLLYWSLTGKYPENYWPVAAGVFILIVIFITINSKKAKPKLKK
jgi:hypothetical protein